MGIGKDGVIDGGREKDRNEGGCVGRTASAEHKYGQAMGQRTSKTSTEH